MRRLATIIVTAMALLASACGGAPTPAGYTALIRTDFLTACTDSLTDSEIVTDVCKCVFDKAQREVSISVFNSYENTLKNDPTAGLPGPLRDMLARCVLEESGLQG